MAKLRRPVDCLLTCGMPGHAFGPSGSQGVVGTGEGISRGIIDPDGRFVELSFERAPVGELRCRCCLHELESEDGLLERQMS